jgi:hypothetical protein
VFAYIDDSCAVSPDRQTPLRHLEVFFNALATNGLAINLEKCIFASLEILGHTMSAAGAAPMAGHIAKIELCPPPQDIKQRLCYKTSNYKMSIYKMQNLKTLNCKMPNCKTSKVTKGRITQC